jgi:putative redox protein
MKVEIKRIDSDFQLEARGSGPFCIMVDKAAGSGGKGEGARPMELMLMSIGTCSTFDVIEILRKQRQDLKNIKVAVDGHRVNGVPSVFDKIHLTYYLQGQVEEKKALRAIDLSVQKYCSASAMLAKTAEITYSIEIEK